MQGLIAAPLNAYPSLPAGLACLPAPLPASLPNSGFAGVIFSIAERTVHEGPPGPEIVGDAWM